MNEENLNQVTMTIGDLFEFNEFLEEVEEDTFKEPIYDINIESPKGIVPIRHLVKKMPEDWVYITLENGKKVQVSINHKFVIQNEKEDKIIFAKDVKVNEYLETKEGLKKVKDIKKVKNTNEYLYGLSLDEPHLYYDTNGILHHNTALLNAIASGISLHKKNILYVTLEMPEYDILKRMDANMLDTEIYKLDKMNFNDYKSKIDMIKDDVGEIVVKEYPAGGFDVLMLKALVDEIEQNQEFKIDAIIIDYLGLMKSTRVGMGAGLYTFYKSIAEELHGFSKKYNVPVITASQLNRSAYGNIDAGMEAISDSMGIVMTADIFVNILTNDELKNNKQVMLKFEKNRYTGKLDKLILKVDWSKMKFVSLESDLDEIEKHNNFKNKMNNIDNSFGVPEQSFELNENFEMKAVNDKDGEIEIKDIDNNNNNVKNANINTDNFDFLDDNIDVQIEIEADKINQMQEQKQEDYPDIFSDEYEDTLKGEPMKNEVEETNIETEEPKENNIDHTNDHTNTEMDDFLNEI